MSLAFNVCLSHDLLKTMKDPFKPGSRRLKFYLLVSTLFASIFAFVVYWQSKDECVITKVDPNSLMSFAT
jgi:hypothetical protein